MATTKRKTTTKRTTKAMTKRENQLKQDVTGILFLGIGIFLAVCIINYDVTESGILGKIGTPFVDFVVKAFGNGKWLLALALVIAGGTRIAGGISLNGVMIFSYFCLLCSGCAIFSLLLPTSVDVMTQANLGLGGGKLGGFLVLGVQTLIGRTGCWIFYIGVILISILVITGKTLSELLSNAKNTAGAMVGAASDGITAIQNAAHEREMRKYDEIGLTTANQIGSNSKGVMESVNAPIGSNKKPVKQKPIPKEETFIPVTPAKPEITEPVSNTKVNVAFDDGSINLFNKNTFEPKTEMPGYPESRKVDDIKPAIEEEKPKIQETVSNVSDVISSHTKKDSDDTGELDIKHVDDKDNAAVPKYKKPPLSLLAPAKRNNGKGNDAQYKASQVQILQDTLASFGIGATVLDVHQGPAITRYEISPAPGVKVSRIVNLQNDIALAMAATSIRIEAPIPGKAAIGIEVPNAERMVVNLREILESNEFKKSKSKLVFALGKDIAGECMVADLAKMPHLLVAGATGSGKSVCMNALIASILFNTTPDEVKLMMIDPKVVELTVYNGIPNLIYPVVTDAKKAAKALRWAVHEMDKRYELFAAAGCKDLARYNEWLAIQDDKEDRKPLPQIVILIDELADLMLAAPADVEDAIQRITQLARACGMHLVVATQRPSVDVVTGVIKANIPSRIAFAVSNQTDSRVILDESGAEKLLGRGDMLCYTQENPKPVRIQGVLVTDQEIEALVENLKAQYNEPIEYKEDITAGVEETKKEEEDMDELLPEAARIFIESGAASVSVLQRRLRVGYTRAGRIVDQLEKMGIIGGFEGSKSRTVRMTLEQWDERFGNQQKDETEEFPS